MIRELDSRISDGIYVRLLWHPDNGRVSITIDDAKTGDAFELGSARGSERSTSTTTPTPMPPNAVTAARRRPPRLTSGRRHESMGDDSRRVDAGLPPDFRSPPREGKRDRVRRFLAGAPRRRLSGRQPSMSPTHPLPVPARGRGWLLLRLLGPLAVGSLGG